MSTLDIKWSADGQTLSIVDKTHMCLFYDATPPEGEAESEGDEAAETDAEQSRAALETLLEESYVSGASDGLDRRVSIRCTPQTGSEAGDLSRLSDVLHSAASMRRLS